MAMKKSGTGSRNVVHKPVITGKPAYGIDPGGVSQWGEAIGNHVTDGRTKLGYRGEPFRNGKALIGATIPLGNEVAAKTVCGVGGSREVFKAGSQGQSSPTRSPNATGRDTLAEFGPDTANARNRR